MKDGDLFMFCTIGFQSIFEQYALGRKYVLAGIIVIDKGVKSIFTLTGSGAKIIPFDILVSSSDFESGFIREAKNSFGNVLSAAKKYFSREKLKSAPLNLAKIREQKLDDKLISSTEFIYNFLKLNKFYVSYQDFITSPKSLCNPKSMPKTFGKAKYIFPKHLPTIDKLISDCPRILAGQKLVKTQNEIKANRNESLVPQMPEIHIQKKKKNVFNQAYNNQVFEGTERLKLIEYLQIKKKKEGKF